LGWGGAPGPSGYAGFRKAAYRGIKRGDPGALVLGGGLSPATGGASTVQSSNGTTNLPPAKHVEVEGALDNFQGSLTLQIPVGPMTHSVGLSVHGGSVSGPYPLVDQRSLIGRDGETLAFAIWYGCARLLEDFLRIDKRFGPLTGSQWTALTVVVVSIALLIVRAVTKRPGPTTPGRAQGRDAPTGGTEPARTEAA